MKSIELSLTVDVVHEELLRAFVSGWPQFSGSTIDDGERVRELTRVLLEPVLTLAGLTISSLRVEDVVTAAIRDAPMAQLMQETDTALRALANGVVPATAETKRLAAEELAHRLQRSHRYGPE